MWDFVKYNILFCIRMGGIDLQIPTAISTVSIPEIIGSYPFMLQSVSKGSGK